MAADVGTAASLVTLDVSASSRVSFALHHNEVPFLHDLSILNSSEEALEDLSLTLTSDPPFLSSRAWHIARVGAGQRYGVQELKVDLNGGMLARLTEAEASQATIVLSDPEREVCRWNQRIELLARNQWGGIGEVPELISAFVVPNDPAVDRILNRAAEILRGNGRDPALDGYMKGSKERVWEMAAGVWGAICALGLEYALPPASFEQDGQKVRSPSQVISGGVGTCLDTSLLFAASLEQCGLHPLVAMLRGHAFAGCWLIDESFPTPIVDDASLLRKRARLGDLVLFETTLATHRPAPGFSDASAAAMRQIAEGSDDAFLLAVDVCRTRMLRIRPLASAEAVTLAAREAPPHPAEPAFEQAPDLGEATTGMDLPSSQPIGRSERWQRRLLDMSLRNGLLNFRALRRSVPFDVPDPGLLEDLLANSHDLKILPSPPLMGGTDPRSRTIYEARHHEDIQNAYARDALGRHEILVPLSESEMNARLIELYRTARTSLEEGGANTLHLALGFLAWTRGPGDSRRYRAPLILLPVSLTRTTVRSGFRLSLHEDEPRFNPTLIEMLRQDFQITIPVVEGPLPRDDSGLDVHGIWRAVGESIKDVRGWEILDEVVLSTFSFAKHLMWKDLVDRGDQLERNPVVHHLMRTPHEPYRSTVPFPDPQQLDSMDGASQLYCPLSFDSSQLTAVMAAARGKDFVLIGPPGTGKSQTIANLIAQCLAQGRTVLFVAEKTAALNVVYQRLKGIGLGEFCLELHSNKARKLEVLAQLRSAWEAKGEADSREWERLAEQLDRLRKNLNRFVEHLHAPQRNGLSAFEAMGRILTGDRVPAVALTWPSADTHDATALAELRTTVGRLAVNGAEVAARTGHPLAGVTQAEWSPGWQASLKNAAQGLLPECTEVVAAAGAVADCTGLPPMDLDPGRRRALVLLASVLPEAAGHDWSFTLGPEAQQIARRLTAALACLSHRAELVRSLSLPYILSNALRLDLNALKGQWLRAEAAWWPLSWWLRRGVRNELAASRPIGHHAPQAVDSDLDRLIAIRACDNELAAFDDLAATTAGLWNGLQTAPDTVTSALEFGKRASEAAAGLADSAPSLEAIRHGLVRLIGEANALLAPGGAAAEAAARFITAEDRYRHGVQTLVQLMTGGADGSSPAGTTPTAVAETCKSIMELEPRLQAWCAWQRARRDGLSAGLGPLITAAEEGAVPFSDLPETFEVTYCRWWLNAHVDGDEVLRTFAPAEQEQRIAEFRSLDDRFRDLTRAVIRARLCGQIPDAEDARRVSAWGILRRELEKKRRHMPLRQLFAALGPVLPRLAPCVLMSPLSIAQYLAPDAAPFDVVVFDEASQIPVWDAVGAIARGKQAVIVGDPKQLPPTTFFDRSTSDAEDEEAEDAELESILDECSGANLQSMNLSWHYRSRHESLIAFSNHRYYDGKLVTFPSPVTEDRAVRYLHVADGVYEKGGDRVNRAEAEALVRHLVSRLRDANFVASGRSIGVVTFNAEQQRLIEDMLDEECRADPSLERFFSDGAQEPVFVKNLESVQGDERDVMYFSITYGPDDRGAVSLNFGPLNRAGGERRLNVAITRARWELCVFATLRPEQLDLTRTGATGVRDLKHFLQYAADGLHGFGTVTGIAEQFGSLLERAVADALATRGWQVRPGVGVSSFLVGLGVVDPDEPGTYLAGIECDGPIYRRSPTARDRDKLREEVLESLGWTIVRVWSTEWWVDPERAAQKLHARLCEALAAAREKRAGDTESQPARAVDGSGPAAPEPGAVSVVRPNGRSHPEAAPAAPALPGRHDEVRFSAYALRLDASDGEWSDSAAVFRQAQPAGPADAEAFYLPAYSATLMIMIREIIAAEGPIRADVLARRIARLHGFQRAGARIQQRISALARREFRRTKEDVGEFFWPHDATPGVWPAFRRPGDSEPRPIDEISLPELRALARSLQRRGLDQDGGVTAMARIAGLQRLRAASRARLEQAWNSANG